MCYSWDRLAHVKMYVSVFRCATAEIDLLMSRCMSLYSDVLQLSWDRLAHVKMYVSVFRCATAEIDLLMSRCMSLYSDVLQLR